MNFKSYVYSLIVLTLFITVFSFVIPKGKLANSIKIVLSSLIIIAIFKPIINFSKKEVKFDESNYSEINIQDGYVFYVRGLSVLEKEKYCDAILVEDGIKGAKTKIEYSFNENISVNKVIILVDENIIINEKTLKKISDYLGVDENTVFVYEK